MALEHLRLQQNRAEQYLSVAAVVCWCLWCMAQINTAFHQRSAMKMLVSCMQEFPEADLL